MALIFSPAEDALLRAALRDGDDALEAFAEWRQLFDFEGEHEAGQFRILPLLHANMVRLGSKDPIMARLRGIHRHAWAEGQRRQHSAAVVLKLLNRENIPTMFTKGLALAQDYYDDQSLRPMQDLDLLVPRSRAEQALEILQQAGWRFMDPLNAYSKGGEERAAFMVLNNGLGLRNAQGSEVDLHWHPLHECGLTCVTNWFWCETEPLTISGISSVRPGPGPLLLHVLSHGLRPNPMSPLRWVADASMIVKRSGTVIDWERFWSIARRCQMEKRLSEGLAIVEQVSLFSLPPGARKEGRSSLVEVLERRAYGGAKKGRLSGVSLLLMRISKLIRLCRAENRPSAFILICQWFRAQTAKSNQRKSR